MAAPKTQGLAAGMEEESGRSRSVVEDVAYESKYGAAEVRVIRLPFSVARIALTAGLTLGALGSEATWAHRGGGPAVPGGGE